MTDTSTIATLVERAKVGDSEAMASLVRKFLRPAYVVALAVLGRPSDAEDVAQDACLLAFERIDTCRENAKFGAWLLQIARNQAKTRLVRRKLRDVPAAESVNEAVSGEPAPDTVGIRKDLLRALALLSPMQREVILLHDLEGWTHKEIGDALGMSEGMSRQHLFFARHGMRVELSGDDGKKEVRLEGGQN